MAFFGQYWYESREIVELMVPTMTSTFLESSMVVVDVIMLGHLGKGHVAAYAIGNGFFNMLWYFIEGFLTAQDTLCSNAYGSGDPKAVRYWSYVSLLSVFILCSAATGIIFFTEYILGSWFFITFHLKTKACVHVYILTPAMWFMGWYRVIQKYHQSRGVMSPSAQASLIGNGANIGLNYLLIFQLGWGFAGCAAATTITRFLMLLLIYRHVKRSSEAFGIYAELGELVRDTPIEGATRGAAHAVDQAQQALENVPVTKARQSIGQGLGTVGRLLGVQRLSRAGAYLEEEDGVELPTFMSHLWGGHKEYDRRKNTASVMPFDASSHSSASEASSHGGDDEESDLNVRVPKDRLPPPDVVSPLSAFAATLQASRAEEAPFKAGEVGGHSTDYLEGVNVTDKEYRQELDGRVSPEREHEEDLNPQEEEDGSESESGGSSEEETRRPLLSSFFFPTSSADSSASSTALQNEPNSSFMVGSLNIRSSRAKFIVRFIRFCALGIPGALLHGMENWIFVAVVMFIARMGSVPLAATQILVVFTEMVYLTVPFSIAVACTHRIGASLGNNNVDKAKAACASSFALGLVFVGGAAGLVYILPLYLAYIFTSDGDVVYRVATLSSIASIFQVAYGLAGLSQGVLKAMGRQSEVASFTLMSLYVLGLPMAYFWGMYVRPTYGLYGFWVGITLGMGALAVILAVLVYSVDWHRECRRANFRLHRERQGFQAVATGDNTTHNAPPAGPRVGRPMLGSRASGGFSLGYTSLQEEMDEVEHVDVIMVQEHGDRDHGA